MLSLPKLILNVLLTCCLFFSFKLYASIPYADQSYLSIDREGTYLERAYYQERIYSRERKTEIGDQTELDVALRYQFDPSAYLRFRFQTDPIENRFDNKTSEFEIVGAYTYGDFFMRLDGELNTNDNGGTSLGLDNDSRGTFLSYERGEGIGFIFYPFNFDSRVGREFGTYDVTRIYFIDGSPSNINNTQLENEKIAQKTIPGIEINYRPRNLKWLKVYAGFGLATYLYPSNSDFDIQNNRIADRWERREVYGHKLGVTYRSRDPQDLRLFNLQYSGHNKTEQTGALLSHAASMNFRTFWQDYFIDAEVTYSKAGKSPYRLSRDSDWFDVTVPFQPVYSDFFGDLHDWIDRSGHALALKLGFWKNEALPYVFFRYQSEHFIFSGRESANRLRTADETLSHGGLTRLGLGLFKQYGKFTLNPEIEWMRAKNPVFSNSADVREDRVLASFRKQDLLLSLQVTYNFDGRLFRE